MKVRGPLGINSSFQGKKKNLRHTKPWEFGKYG